MPRRLLLANVLLVMIAALCVAYIVRELTATPPAPPRRARPPAAASAPAPPAVPRPATAGTWAVVVARNLFSPTRSDGPATPVAASPAAARPYLYGVVLREGGTVAYLEDPATKRVAGYRVGDAIGGGTLRTIAADHVVIARADGELAVRLRDPSKPRPAAAPPATAPAGVPRPPGAPPTAPPPAAIPGVRPGLVPPGVLPRGVFQPPQTGMPFIPSRRLSPFMFPRTPPPTAPDAGRQ